MDNVKKSGFPWAALGLAISLLAVTSSWLLWQELKTTKALVSQLNSTAAGIKPWAFSQRELRTALEDVKQVAVVEGSSSELAKTAPKMEAVERRYGDPEAQFEIVEFSDFECTYCKSFFPVPKALVDGSRGNISLLFKHVPVHGDASRREAYAAECAGAQGGNDAFYRMADAIFQSTSSGGAGTNKPLSSIAEDLGLNGQELASCIDSNFFVKKVRADFKEAVDLGIDVTPSTLIRHKPTGQTVLIKEAVTPERLLSAMGNLVKMKADQK